MIPPCNVHYDVYNTDWCFEIAHDSERRYYYDDEVFNLRHPDDVTPHGPDMTRLHQILANMQAQKETVIALVLEDPEFNKDPTGYLNAWESLQPLQSTAAIYARKYLQARIHATQHGIDITRLEKIMEDTQAGKEAIIALVLDDPEFNKDPETYLNAWETLQILQTTDATYALNDLKARVNNPTYWLQSSEMSASDIIEKIEHDPAYKNDPKAYLRGWIDARKSRVGSHPEEDAAFNLFRQLWYLEDDLR